MNLDPPAARAALPGAHLGLTWRPITTDDLASSARLAVEADAVDTTNHPFTRARIAAAIASGVVDLERDSAAGVGPDGALCAMALVLLEPERDRVLLLATVHPAWRSRGIGRAVLRWQDERAREVLAERVPAPGGGTVRARIGVLVDEHLTDRRRLCVAAGYTPARWFQSLHRRLSADGLPAREAPSGVRIAQLSDEHVDAVRLAHNEAFADHWETAPYTPGRWAERMHQVHVPWSFVAIAEDGEIAGYLLSGRDPGAWTEGTFGTTDHLGVRPRYRHRGIGRALLIEAMHAYAADDMQGARLEVDTRNRSGALALYAGLGYEARHATVLYSIEL